MMQAAVFVFNPFQENTYVLYDETGECVIVDPGCYSREEKEYLADFVRNEGLKPVKLLNTHCHIDHILGNRFAAEHFGLELEMHRADLPLLKATDKYGPMYGIFAEPSPDPARFLEDGGKVRFGKTVLDIIFTPGHSPGSVCLFEPQSKKLVAGDVLFQMSIGRTDLPGGSHDTLLNSIVSRLWPLPAETEVLPGHGPATTIGFEKEHNPFLQGE